MMQLVRHTLSFKSDSVISFQIILSLLSRLYLISHTSLHLSTQSTTFFLKAYDPMILTYFVPAVTNNFTCWTQFLSCSLSRCPSERCAPHIRLTILNSARSLRLVCFLFSLVLLPCSISGWSDGGLNGFIPCPTLCPLQASCYAELELCLLRTGPTALHVSDQNTSACNVLLAALSTVTTIMRSKFGTYCRHSQCPF